MFRDRLGKIKSKYSMKPLTGFIDIDPFEEYENIQWLIENLENSLLRENELRTALGCMIELHDDPQSYDKNTSIAVAREIYKKSSYGV